MLFGSFLHSSSTKYNAKSEHTSNKCSTDFCLLLHLVISSARSFSKAWAHRTQQRHMSLFVHLVQIESMFHSKNENMLPAFVESLLWKQKYYFCLAWNDGYTIKMRLYAFVKWYEAHVLIDHMISEEALFILNKICKWFAQRLRWKSPKSTNRSCIRKTKKKSN